MFCVFYVVICFMFVYFMFSKIVFFGFVINAYFIPPESCSSLVNKLGSLITDRHMHKGMRLGTGLLVECCWSVPGIWEFNSLELWCSGGHHIENGSQT